MSNKKHQPRFFKKQTKKHKNNNQIKTIYARLYDIEFDIFRKVFDNSSWRLVNKAEMLKKGYVDMMLLFGWDMFDKDLWRVKSMWKSLISIPDMFNKYELHKLLQNSDFIAKTVLIDKSGEPPNLSKISKSYRDEIWIWRTDNKTGGGMDVVVVSNQEELNSVFKEFQNKKINYKLGGTRALLSKYITNPSLWINPHNKKSYKYHLRIYLIVVADKNKIRACVFKNNEIVLAEKPYQQGNWNNTDIHDTHFKHGFAVFPDDYSNQDIDANDVILQIFNILKTVIKKTCKSLELFKESSVFYQIFGCDFMLENNGKVILIEINNMPGFKLIPIELYKGTTKYNSRKYIQEIAMTNTLEYVVNYKLNKYNGKIEDQLKNKSLNVVEILNDKL